RGSPVDVHLCDELLDTRRVVPFEPIRPDLPVGVTFRPSVGGGSLVAQYRNTSGRHLEVVVTVRSPTLNQARTVTVAIRPGGLVEDGWAEGWRYISPSLTPTTRPLNWSSPEARPGAGRRRNTWTRQHPTPRRPADQVARKPATGSGCSGWRPASSGWPWRSPVRT